MPDVNPSAENIRATLTETLGRLRKANADYFELLEKGLASSPLPIRDQAQQFCNFVQRNVTATFDLGDKLIQVKKHAGRGQGPVRIFPGADEGVD
jgi:hypothetical protein